MSVLKVKVISLPYIFPGFVCFVVYLAKISGERLQDHWSSGYEEKLSPIITKYAMLSVALRPVKGPVFRFSLYSFLCV